VVSPPGERVGELIERATGRLRAAGSPSPRLDAQLLLGHVTGWDRAAQLAHPEWHLARDQVAAFDALVRRRVAAEPIAYLLGEREFFGHLFRVDRRALIPRPETELLVELGIAGVERWRQAGIWPRVVEVGTGSGAVAISLALACGVDVVATELAWPALTLARENAQRLGARAAVPPAHGPERAEGGIAAASHQSLSSVLCHPERSEGSFVVPAQDDRLPFKGGNPPQQDAAQSHAREPSSGSPRSRVRLVQTDLLDGLRGPIHVLLANLPYVPRSRQLPPDVRDYEPHQAIFGGERGTELIERLLHQARPLLAPGGELCVELDEEEQAQPIAALAGALYAGADISIRQDAGGYERVVRVRVA
jgi:methylase of polypeptide subunit release factors